MIKYILECDNSHEFESWFADSNEYDKLKKKNLIECIFCQSQNINKSIMSPGVLSRNTNKNKDFLNKNTLIQVKKDLLKIKKFVEKNFDFVGDKFTQEVRNIYYSKSKKRNIYGFVTPEDKKELNEEGIELTSIPWVKEDN